MCASYKTTPRLMNVYVTVTISEPCVVYVLSSISIGEQCLEFAGLSYSYESKYKKFLHITESVSGRIETCQNIIHLVYFDIKSNLHDCKKYKQMLM